MIASTLLLLALLICCVLFLRNWSVGYRATLAADDRLPSAPGALWSDLGAPTGAPRRARRGAVGVAAHFRRQRDAAGTLDLRRGGTGGGAASGPADVVLPRGPQPAGRAGGDARGAGTRGKGVWGAQGAAAGGRAAIAGHIRAVWRAGVAGALAF